MATVAEKNARPELSPEQRALLDRILRLRPTQQKRILELVDLYQRASNEKEEAEICEALGEILFRDCAGLAATRLDEDEDTSGIDALGKHRVYVGEQIRKQRQRLRMSQEELAKAAGIPQSHVCRLETGKHAPTYLTIEKLSAALGVKPSSLDPGFDDED